MTQLHALLAEAAEVAVWWTLASLTAGLFLARIGWARKKTRPTPPHRSTDD